MVRIPEKSREEWKMMVKAEVVHTYKNFVLQLQLHQIQKDVKTNKTTVLQAVDIIYNLCLKYALAVQEDLKVIFKNW